MRHLIDTYIEADEPRTISPFDNIGLLELIVKTGIADAIAAKLGALKGNKDAVAETIENNLRSKITKENLNDPAYYETMSALLDAIIAARKAKAIAYEEYLKRIADLVQKVEAGVAEDTPEQPEQLNKSPALRALCNNLKPAGETQAQAGRVAEPPNEYAVSGGPTLELAFEIDAAVKRARPDGWRGVQASERVIKAALYGILWDVDEVLKDIKNVSASIPRRPCARLGSEAHEHGNHSCVRHLQARLDQAAAKEAPGTGARDTARLRGPGEPLPVGQALFAYGLRER